MARLLHFALLLPALATVNVRAQDAAPATPPPDNAANAIVKPAEGVPADTIPAPTTVKRLREDQPRATHAVSSEVAAQLAASRPKFSPVAPPPPPKPEEELADLREVDKPKNTIVRLPKFVVKEPRPPIFTEREIHTKQGLADLAMRRYLTETDRAMNRYTLPLFHPYSVGAGSSNEERALAMYAEDERLKNMADMADKTNMVQRSDSTAGKKMQNESRDTFMRWQDFGWQGGKPE